MKIKNYFGFILPIFFSACTRTDNPTTTNNVSGKIKRIVIPLNGKTSNITAFEYDANNRLTKWNEFTVDSSTTTPTISKGRFVTFYYSGSNNYPAKNIITDGTTSSSIDSTLYYYDSASVNKVIREETFISGILRYRFIYSYNALMLIRKCFNGYFNNNAITYTGLDSILYDSQLRIVDFRGYNVPNNQLILKRIYMYDSKINPLSSINVSAYINSINNDEESVANKSMNNYINYVNTNYSTSITYSQTSNYIYSTNSYPISATSLQTISNPPSPISTTTTKETFEYY